MDLCFTNAITLPGLIHYVNVDWLQKVWWDTKQVPCPMEWCEKNNSRAAHAPARGSLGYEVE